jgi:uncharacterized membrane protein
VKTHIKRTAAAAMSAVLLSGGLSAEAAEPAAATQACRLVALTMPPRAYDGGLIDIAKVGSKVLYYGSVHRRDADGVEHQRAVIWRGLGGRPQRVGPRGFDADIALELTETGLVNGVSEDFSTGRARAWVQNLRTGRLRFFDTRPGSGSTSGYPWVRRINNKGQAVGSVDRAHAEPPRSDALFWRGLGADPVRLPAQGHDASATGINERGDAAGFIVTDEVIDEDFFVFKPVIWKADGTRVTLATPHGLDAAPRDINNDGQVAGGLWWGEDTSGHPEAGFWPTPRRAIGLGLLPKGRWSDAFGIDDDGRLVGAMDRYVGTDNPHADDWGWVAYSFLWTPQTTPGTVRIMPTLHAFRQGIRDWRRWYGNAMHAINTDLNQAGTGTHVRFTRSGRPRTAPTVFLNADTCGIEVRTTHQAHVPEHAGDSRSSLMRQHRLLR